MAEIQLVAERLRPAEIVETLQSFLERERLLFERMPYDPTAKKAMLYGISCLVAAAARLSPNSDPATSSEPGTPAG